MHSLYASKNGRQVGLEWVVTQDRLAWYCFLHGLSSRSRLPFEGLFLLGMMDGDLIILRLDAFVLRWIVLGL